MEEFSIPKNALRSAKVTFHSLSSGGDAVGRDENGKTIFAPFTAPEDITTLAIEAEKSSFARGLLRSIETPSPYRVTAPCPQFRPHTPLQSCGGCAWQHIALETQRQAKRDIVVGALQRIGGYDELSAREKVAEVRGGAGFGYRNKADFVIGHGENGPEIGFFARESHDLIDAPNCPIQNPHNEAILRAARSILARHPQAAFDARSGRGFWRRLVARVASNGESLATLIVGNEAAMSSAQTAQIAQQLRAEVPHLVGVLAAQTRGESKVLWGRDYLMESANGLNFRVSGSAFWQVNPEMSPLLAQSALEMAGVQSGERALDLFCGAGFFALHLARAGAQVTGIEMHGGAIRDADFNAQNNGLKADFRAGDVAKALARFKKGDFDLILLDPPRAGARESLSDVIRIQAPRLIYISCDPATWARDAKTLGENGYILQRAIPFDLFPQTAHVEVLSLFEFEG